MKKIIFFLIIALGIGLFFFLKHDQKAAGLQDFYKLTSEDPLFYSPFFDSNGWEKSIARLKKAEDDLKKVYIENYSKVAPDAGGIKKNDYVSIPETNDLFPYQFLKDLILINQKTNKFLETPSAKLARELLELYDNAADSYLQNISSKIKILDDDKSARKTTKPTYFLFIDSGSNSNVVESDFLTIKENGNKLKEEIEKRKKCLSGQSSCPRTLPDDNNRINDFVDSLNAKFDLKGEKIDFIKNTLLLSSKPYLKPGKEISGPYKIKSSCWQGLDSEHWMYLAYLSDEKNDTVVLPKLATQNYYWKNNAPAGTIENGLASALRKKGFIFYSQYEAAPYECTNLTFYPQLLTLDFIKEKIKGGEITLDKAIESRNYKLLIENQFGIISPMISLNSNVLEIHSILYSITNSAFIPSYIFSKESAYSIFFFPFAKSIWRIDKKLQYFSSQEEQPLTLPKAVVLDELLRLGYTLTQIEKFQTTPELYRSLFPEVKL